MLLIDKMSTIPIYHQVIEQIESLILKGVLKENSLLPSVRILSKEISVNPNTLQKAYMHLEIEGLCVSIPGSGRYIAKGALKIIQEKKKKDLSKLDSIIADAKLSGLELEQILQYVTSVYKEVQSD